MAKKPIIIYDFTGELGQAGSGRAWEMYSFDRVAFIFWNAFANTMIANGWSKEEVQWYLQSKHTRWALDGWLEDRIEKFAAAQAKGIAEDDRLHMKVRGYVANGE